MLGKLALLVSKVSVSLKTQKKITLLVKSVFRYLEFKAHKEILFQNFSLPVFFCLRLCYPFNKIILFLKSLLIFL